MTKQRKKTGKWKTRSGMVKNCLKYAGTVKHGKASALAPYRRILPRHSTEQFRSNWWNQEPNDFICCTARNIHVGGKDSNTKMQCKRLFPANDDQYFFHYFIWFHVFAILFTMAIICLGPAPHSGCPSDTKHPFHVLALRDENMECSWWR